MDCTNTVYIYDGKDTWTDTNGQIQMDRYKWTDTNGVEWNQEVI